MADTVEVVAPATAPTPKKPKRFKWLKRIALALVILVVVVIGSVLMFLPGFVRGKVEDLGSEYLKTEVTLGGVSLSPLSGSVSLHNLAIKNYPGYSQKNMLTIKDVGVNVSLSSLSTGTIIIDRAFLDGTEANLEVNNAGQKNLDVAMKNVNDSLNAPKEPKAQPKPPGKEGSKKKAEEGKGFLLRELVISGVACNFTDHFSQSDEMVSGTSLGKFTMNNLAIPAPGKKAGSQELKLHLENFLLTGNAGFTKPKFFSIPDLKVALDLGKLLDAKPDSVINISKIDHAGLDVVAEDTGTKVSEDPMPENIRQFLHVVLNTLPGEAARRYVVVAENEKSTDWYSALTAEEKPAPTKDGTPEGKSTEDSKTEKPKSEKSKSEKSKKEKSKKEDSKKEDSKKENSDEEKSSEGKSDDGKSEEAQPMDAPKEGPKEGQVAATGTSKQPATHSSLQIDDLSLKRMRFELIRPLDPNAKVIVLDDTNFTLKKFTSPYEKGSSSELVFNTIPQKSPSIVQLTVNGGLTDKSAERKMTIVMKTTQFPLETIPKLRSGTLTSQTNLDMKDGAAEGKFAFTLREFDADPINGKVDKIMPVVSLASRLELPEVTIPFSFRIKPGKSWRSIMKEFLGQIAKGLPSSITGAISSAGAIVDDAGKRAIEAGTAVADSLGNVGDAAVDALGNVGETATDTIKGGAEIIGNAGGAATDTVKGGAKRVGNAAGNVKDRGKGVLNKVTGKDADPDNKEPEKPNTDK